MAALPLHSVVVASDFRASDYLIPFGAALGSPSGSEAPAPAAKGCVAASPQRRKHHLLRVVCPPAGQEAESEECQSFRSASTASIPAETRSPNHRRRPAWPASVGGAGASSSGESDVGDDAAEPEGSQPAAAACSGDRYGACPASPSSSSSSAGSSSSGSPPADTPSPCPLLGSPPSGCGVDAAAAGSARHGLITPLACPLASDGNGSSSFSGSWGATPGSRGGSSLQQQLEVAEARLLAETEARCAVQRRLAEQRADAEQQRQALGRHYEEQLAGLRREVQAAAGSASAQALAGSVLAAGGRFWRDRACCMRSLAM